MFNNNILLLSHHNEVPGLGHKIADYLSRHFQLSIFASHPLVPSSSVKSFIKIHSKHTEYKINRFLQYFLEGLYLYKNFRKYYPYAFKFHLIFCLDPLSYFHAYLFKKLGLVKQIIYFNVDYSSKRFNFWLMNKIYVFLNKFAYINCDYFFHITTTGVKEIDPKNKYKYKNCLITHTIKRVNFPSVKKIPGSIIFSGNITYSTDFADLIQALIKLYKNKIHFIFDIYGDGEKKKELQQIITNSTIKKYVHFKGVIDNKKLTENIMPKYWISIAPYTLQEKYNKNNPSHVYAGESLSTKIVEYIGRGLPIIATRPFPAFDVIRKYRFGYLVKNSQQWYDAIAKLLIDKETLKEYSINAYQYSKKFDEETVFTPLFKKIIGSI